MRVKQIMYAISLALLLPNITCAQQVTLGNAIQIAQENSLDAKSAQSDEL